MEKFIVLKEQTFKFKEVKLYLMLLLVNEHFGVEIVNNKETFGRKHLDKRKEAEKLFDLIDDRVCRCKNLPDAEAAMKRCFSLKKLNQMVFVLLAEDKILSQHEIGRIVINNKPDKVKTKYDYLGNKKQKGAITIYVFFDTKRKPIGRFSGKRFSKEFTWESIE